MKHHEILEKVFKKVEANGFKLDDWDFMIKRDGSVFDTAWLPSLLFNHDFAKAFWGKEMLPVYALGKKFDEDEKNRVHKVYTPAWCFHLQEMVLEEEPIKYLEQFI